MRALGAVGLALLLASGAGAQRAARTGERPNVVMIVVDDLNAAVGFLSEEPGNPLLTLYPDPAVRAQVQSVLTPNLDRLAASGVPFARAYAPSPICAPSRAAVMTGVRPHASRFDDNGDGLWRQNPVLAEARTLPEHLRRHGYFTAGLGKVFHRWQVELDARGQVAVDGPDVARSWEVWINAAVGAGRVEAWSPWSVESTELRMGVAEGTLDDMKDVQNATAVADLLQFGAATFDDAIYDIERTVTLPSDRPFFLALGLYRPHTPLTVPRELLDLFDPADLALSDSLLAVFADDTADLAPGGRARIFRGNASTEPGPTATFYAHADALDPDGGRVAAWTDLVRHYLAAVALADRAVGRVMDALDAGPYADDTIVVLWGDHGWHLGEKTWFGKTTLWEESAHAPLIVRTPEAVAPGVLRRQPVSLMDLYPTIAAAAGLPIPPHVQGADLGPALIQPQAPVGAVALTTMGRDDHALRTRRHRYIRYGDLPLDSELYDEDRDPDERDNLADDDLRITLNTALDAALNRAPAPVRTPPDRPLATRLGHPAPNPTADGIVLDLALETASEVGIEVQTVLGQSVWRQRLG
ncbi:MAG: sulfatase, partial [Bacteroidota bacterium]